jgi:glycosyltransferase involved in cell wall biosynthesis
MKILIVTQYFWPENFKITDLAIALKGLNHEVTVLTGKPNYPEGKFYKGYNFFNKRAESFKGVEIIRTMMIRRGSGNGFRLFVNYFSFAFFASFASVFRIKKNYDIIFVFEPSPITVALPSIVYKKFSNAPIFLWVLDLWPESISAAGNINSVFIIKQIDNLVKRIYRNTDIILISSKSFRESIISKGISDKKIVYLPNWAEDIFLQKIDHYSEALLKLPKGSFNVMFAGNIGDAQDFESIIKAAELTKSYENIHWIIIGDGRKKVWVESQITSLNLKNVHLLGKHPIEKMPYFYKEADVMLVTLKDEKIFSLTVPAKIQSYLACGKPLVALLNGVGADIINESGAGFCFNSGNYEELSGKIIEMYKMPKNELVNMGLSGKKYYDENFERNKLISNLLNVFQEHLI